MPDFDPSLIRRTIEIAWNARQRGNHPFGALLADPKGEILLEAENSVVTTGDITGHAETNLIRSAAAKYSREFLAVCTIYTSTEPCPMCAGAVFWSNIRRVVFGLSEESLYQLIGTENTSEVLRLPCREVFQRGQKEIAVLGPVLEKEAREVHLDFWDTLT